MSLPEDDDPRPRRPTRVPGIYARLAEEAEVRLGTRTPSRGARWVGWAICLALAVGVIVATLRASPW